MEPSIVIDIPVIRRAPANDAAIGGITLRTPDDVLKSPEARNRAGLVPDHNSALPDIGETINILITENCGYPPALIGTIKLATCKLVLDPARILVDFAYGEGDYGTRSAWVTQSQITYPKRNAECGVV